MRWASGDRQVRLGRVGGLLSRVLRGVFLFCMCFVVLYPILYMVSVSLRTTEDLFDLTIIWIPKTFTLVNYTEVIDLIGYVDLLRNSVFIALVSTLLNVTVCAMVGYGFARFRFRLRNLAFALVLFTIIVPPQNVSIPLYMQYKDFDFIGIGSLIGLFTGQPVTVNLLNTPLTMFVPAALGIGLRSGLFIYIFRQFFRGIPRELDDAAYIDGCSVPGTFLKIMVPNASAAFVSCFLFSFVWYWNDFYQMSMYFNEPVTVTTALGMLEDTLRGAGMNAWANPYIVVTRMQAACVLTILPMLLLYIGLQRFFRESIERTGIVG